MTDFDAGEVLKPDDWQPFGDLFNLETHKAGKAKGDYYSHASVVAFLVSEWKKAYLGQQVQVGKESYTITEDNRVFGEVNAFYQFVTHLAFYQVSPTLALQVTRQLFLSEHPKGDNGERVVSSRRKQPYFDVYLLLLAHHQVMSNQTDVRTLTEDLGAQSRQLSRQVKRVSAVQEEAITHDSMILSLLGWLVLERQGLTEIGITKTLDDLVDQFDKDKGSVGALLSGLPNHLAKDRIERDLGVLDRGSFRKD